MATKNEMAKSEDNAMAAFNEERPDWLPTESERGQENVGVEDLIIPRLDIIQALSPQRKRNDPAYIEGAEDGMMFNSVTGQLYGDAVFFVPCYYRKEYILWKDRDHGGGFGGAFPTMEQAEAAKAEMEDGDEYEVVDTGQHFGLLVDPSSTADEPVVENITISMAKSKAKVSRKLNTLVKMAGGDRFSRVYKISTFDDENKNGDQYFNFDVKNVGYVSKALYELGEKLYDAVASGQKDVVREVPKSEADEANAEY